MDVTTGQWRAVGKMDTKRDGRKMMARTIWRRWMMDVATGQQGGGGRMGNGRNGAARYSGAGAAHSRAIGGNDGHQRFGDGGSEEGRGQRAVEAVADGNKRTAGAAVVQGGTFTQ
ncbi:hypothetical protein CYMTET_31983 [Cymbomonas tetramitiformis]|uniref:Uncharacterized protein n=1 Tax=Cymbomonas tetramitiformis TaxID=36881 RepID=A0AAE0FFY0_9CHLO|nr:hypothetical protein CYMTET_31983 [Cymbomonas tetramitiformis]